MAAAWRRLGTGIPLVFWYAAAAPAAPTGSSFRHNFSKKLSPGPKNGLERRASRFSTICAKNQQLKLSIDKVILEQSASLK